MSLKKSSRHQVRVQVFELIFEQIVTGKESGEILVDAFDSRDIELDDFGERLFLGVFERSEEIDDIISKNIKGWSINRISKVSYAILRLAIYELLCEEDIPVSVSINEAVEIAKEYGSDEDASYVNGVLSSVEKALKPKKNVESLND